MNIPNNSLMEKIKELVRLCEQLASDYGDDASWFKQPASDEMISNWENKHNVFIPETYKEWLSFTNEAQIRNTLAHFYGPDKFVMNSGDLPEDLIVIADLIGDGEQLCFSKITKNFVWVDHGELEIIDDFGAVLSEIIRMLKPKSCLSLKMEELLMNMVKQNNSQDKKEKFIMIKLDLAKELNSNAYPGRGIVIGKSDCGKYAVTAYFIMGRSENSRNRVFVEEGNGIRTEAFDPSKLTDPHLIIYAPVRVLGNKLIVTNGDQTDTIYELMDKQYTFEQSLRTREFEDDAPNYTPRISGILHFEDGGFNYAMSILKSNNGDPDCCLRHTFTYSAPLAGEGRFIHTYMGNGNPLPSFEGEPKLVGISGGIDEFTEMLWNNLNEDNKVSLFVRYVNLEDGSEETRIVNKNK